MAEEDVVIYEGWDFSDLIACRGEMADGGMFRLSESDSDPTWEYVPSTSPAWDIFHQRIYRSYRVDELTDPARLASLPPVPEKPDTPEVERRSYESYYLPEEPVYAFQFPFLIKEMDRRSVDSVVLTVRLFEDEYESRFGDGCFLYLEACALSDLAEEPPFHFDKDTARESPDSCYYRRHLTVARAGGVLSFPHFRLGLFEHYRPLVVLQKVEEPLKGASGS